MTLKYHLIGIGGIGMSSLARILLERGEHVSGSDLTASSITEELVQRGAFISIGHSPSHISPGMRVVYNTDIPKDNPEYLAALHHKCPVLHRSQLLAHLVVGRKMLAVTGTHGKTTTTSLLAWTLQEGGLDPSFSVGGIVHDFRTNGREGTGSYFVAEADESDGSFLNYTPFGAIVTNIGLDHMNYFGTEEALKKGFQDFLLKVLSSEFLFWCGDDLRLRSFQTRGVSYGFEKHCQFRASRFRQVGWYSVFDASFEERVFPQIEISLTGHHNALNALAVLGISLRLGISEEKIRKAFKSFNGVARRCEKKGEKNGILFLDDYAHHPTEIKSTLEAIRAASPNRRLVAVFQPHRFTRTRDCLGTYGSVFDAADTLIITDIYSAGEPAIPGVDAVNILNEINTASKLSSCYVPREELSSKLPRLLQPGDVMVTLGAGNITKVGPETIRNLSS